MRAGSSMTLRNTVSSPSIAVMHARGGSNANEGSSSNVRYGDIVTLSCQIENGDFEVVTTLSPRGGITYHGHRLVASRDHEQTTLRIVDPTGFSQMGSFLNVEDPFVLVDSSGQAVSSVRGLRGKSTYVCMRPLGNSNMLQLEVRRGIHARNKGAESAKEIRFGQTARICIHVRGTAKALGFIRGGNPRFLVLEDPAPNSTFAFNLVHRFTVEPVSSTRSPKHGNNHAKRAARTSHVHATVPTPPVPSNSDELSMRPSEESRSPVRRAQQEVEVNRSKIVVDRLQFLDTISTIVFIGGLLLGAAISAKIAFAASTLSGVLWTGMSLSRRCTVNRDRNQERQVDKVPARAVAKEKQDRVVQQKEAPTIESRETEEASIDLPPMPERYLIAEGGDEDAARRRWAETLTWRKENGVDSILSQAQPYFSTIKGMYPHYFHKKDKTGRFYTYYSCPAKLNIAELEDKGITMDDLVRHIVFTMEYIWTIAEPSPDGKLLTVLDMTGISLRKVLSRSIKEFLTKTVKLMSTHYPERTFKTFIINVPRWFYLVWSLIQPFLTERQRNKITIRSDDGREDLLELIDEDSLPTAYGGNCNDAGKAKIEMEMAKLAKKLSNGE
eukprot:g4407.t1